MIFNMRINIKVFYKLTGSFLLVVARYAQSTQNSKFVIPLQYLKKEGRDVCMYIPVLSLSVFVRPFTKSENL